MKHRWNTDNFEGHGVISIPSISVFHLCSIRASFTRSECVRHHVSLSPWGDDHNQNGNAYQKPPPPPELVSVERCSSRGAVVVSSAPPRQARAVADGFCFVPISVLVMIIAPRRQAHVVASGSRSAEGATDQTQMEHGYRRNRDDSMSLNPCFIRGKELFQPLRRVALYGDLWLS